MRHFDNADRTKQLLSAILAVALWSLEPVGFDVKVT